MAIFSPLLLQMSNEVDQILCVDLEGALDTFVVRQTRQHQVDLLFVQALRLPLRIDSVSVLD